MAAAAHRLALRPQAYKTGLDPRRHLDALLFPAASQPEITVYRPQKPIITQRVIVPGPA
jgi:hypothetical protein